MKFKIVALSLVISGAAFLGACTASDQSAPPADSTAPSGTTTTEPATPADPAAPGATETPAAPESTDPAAPPSTP
ncbi:hypothetical protein HC931_01860 [Candidatus Gracilibacteria bacterium]|jgi:hypothetical protein|nr:hypothetical protein [Candidatus Gracilibacteria bacterium]NJM86819.1 hypothetical protein [Hydrococcus sp. RU_2_2]NJP17852.1 hypothetical protein [Hydrococcus sp. CRU_1_1]